MLCGVTVRENDRQAEGCVCVPLFSACAHTHSPTIALLHKFTLRVCRAVIVSVCVCIWEKRSAKSMCVRTNERKRYSSHSIRSREIFIQAYSVVDKGSCCRCKVQTRCQRQAINWISFRFIYHILVLDVLVLCRRKCRNFIINFRGPRMK